MPSLSSLKQKNYKSSGCSQCLNGKELDFDFSMAFQPIIDVRNKRVFAQEALARGIGGEPARDVFQNVSEDNLYRFDQNCRVKAIELASRFDSDALISINFMPRAVYRPELCIRTTFEAAEAFSFDPGRIMFEFTENERVDDGAHLREIIEYYKSKGFKTAIDDFGAGYSGLNLLTEFKPDLIKLDMNLIRGIDRDDTRKTIVRSVVLMCFEMGVDVIAEGVETLDEKRCLENIGIYLFQGYLFAKPSFEHLRPVEEVEFLL